MFRQILINRNLILSRLYNNSAAGARQKQSKLPHIKLANSRVSRTSRDRLHSEAQIKVDHDPQSPTRFEPYPFAVTAENQFDCLKRVLSPLHDIPYDEQLSTKESFCRNALRRFGQELYKSGTPVRLDVKRLPCQVSEIVRAQRTDKYRSKDELSIWRGYDGETITAGHMIFPIGKHGDTVCVEPEGIEVMKDESMEISKLIQEFLRDQAKLGVCFSLGTDGGWRRFMIRVNNNGELMLIGILSPRTLRVREVLEERDNFKEFMVRRCADVGLKLASLYYQPCPNNQCKHRVVPYELLHGSETLIETIGPYKIHISPESFMHNSTTATELVYKTIKTTIQTLFSNENNTDGAATKPLILDLNCGSGSLAIYLANAADQVVGVGDSDQSINYARASAQLNNVDNVEFIAAQVEIVFERVLDRYNRDKRDIIVICDAPNRGLHSNVLHVLRHNPAVQKLIVIVPRIGASKALDAMLGLCSKSKANSLPPFAPILAVPIDTAPHTESFQTIVVFERLPQ